MAELKRTYNIPLRKEWSNVPNYQRAKRAVKAVRSYLARHMKGEVKLGRHLNMLLWERGIKRPPHHVTVDAIKDDKNIIKAELPGFAYEEKKVEPEKSKIKETLNLLTGKKEEKTEEKKEEKPDVEKKEISEAQKPETAAEKKESEEKKESSPKKKSSPKKAEQKE